MVGVLVSAGGIEAGYVMVGCVTVGYVMVENVTVGKVIVGYVTVEKVIVGNVTVANVNGGVDVVVEGGIADKPDIEVRDLVTTVIDLRTAPLSAVWERLVV